MKKTFKYAYGVWNSSDSEYIRDINGYYTAICNHTKEPETIVSFVDKYGGLWDLRNCNIPINHDDIEKEWYDEPPEDY